MSERDEFFQSGQSPSDSGKSSEMLEGKDTFGSGRVKPVSPGDREELEAMQGPGGDSRPDQTDPHSGGFDSIDADPRMTTTREAHDQPEIRKEDPAFLAEHRVDQKDEVVGRPTGIGGEEIAVLQKKQRKGAEPEEL